MAGATTLDRTLAALAVGRIVLGAASRPAPGATARTVAGVGHLRRRDVPLASALVLTAYTGSYMLIGGAKVARDLRRRG